MRVLNVGCGAGEVALLTASLVGSNGGVVGVELCPMALSAARDRTSHLPNVRFVQADASAVRFDAPFDAVVGRLALSRVRRPLQVVRNAMRLVRPGGVLAFQELDLTGARAYPDVPLFRQCIDWMSQALNSVGADLAVGIKLHSLFLNAGLPPPQLRVDAAAGSGPGHSAYELMADLIRSLMPLLEQAGAALPADSGLDSLAERIEEEVLSSDGVLVPPALIGAWCRVPQ